MCLGTWALTPPKGICHASLSGIARKSYQLSLSFTGYLQCIVSACYRCDGHLRASRGYCHRCASMLMPGNLPHAIVSQVVVVKTLFAADLTSALSPVSRAARASSTSDEQCSSPSARTKYLRAMGRLAAGEMHSQQELVEHLKSHKWLESEHCVSAMLRVDRRDFVQPDMPPRLAYQVCNIPLVSVCRWYT